MNHDDDQAWLDLMAGRASDDATPRTRAEAAWLRAAMLTYKVRVPVGDVPDAAQRVQRLLGRAVRAGVLVSVPAHRPDAAARAGRGGSTTPRGFWRVLRTALASPLGAVAAALVVVAAGTVWVAGPGRESDDPVMRGAPTVQQVRSAQPEAARERAMALLRAAGFEVSAFTRLRRLGLEVEIPATMSPEQTRALRELGLTAPAAAMLVVEFLAP